MVAPPGIPKIVVASSSFRYSSRSCATVSPDRWSPNCVAAGIPAGAVGAACIALPPRESAYSIALRTEREGAPNRKGKRGSASSCAGSHRRRVRCHLVGARSSARWSEAPANDLTGFEASTAGHPDQHDPCSDPRTREFVPPLAGAHAKWVARIERLEHADFGDADTLREVLDGLEVVVEAHFAMKRASSFSHFGAARLGGRRARFL